MDTKNTDVDNGMKYIFWAIVILALFLRLPGMKDSIWLDELAYSTSIFLRDSAALWKATLVDMCAPFYRMVMFVWIRGFGDSEIFIRLPSLICGLFSIALTYKLALRFFKAEIAVLAALLISLSPVHIWYSHEATPYSLLLFLFLSAIFSYYKLNDTGKVGWYLVYIVSAVMALFSHYLVILYLAAFSVISIIGKTKYRNKIIIANVIMSFALVLYMIIKAVINPIWPAIFSYRSFNLFDLWMLFFNWFSFGNSIWSVNPREASIRGVLANPVMLSAQIFVLLLLVKGLMYALKKPLVRRAADPAIYLFILPVFMLFMNSIGMRHFYVERSLFIAVPFFFMFLSAGILAVKNPILRKGCLAAVIIFNIVVLVLFFKSRGEEWTVYQPKPDWRSAAQYLTGELSSTDMPLLVYAITPVSELLYYGLVFDDDVQLAPGLRFLARDRIRASNSTPMFVYYYAYNKDTDYSVTKFREEGYRFFYAIENTQWKGDFDEFFDKLLNNTKLRLIEVRPFRSLRIYKMGVS